MQSLEQLRIGQSATVSHIAPEAVHLRQKFLAMGLTPGCTVNVERYAPFGDPLVVNVRGTALCLRKAEARAIFVEVNQ